MSSDLVLVGNKDGEVFRIEIYQNFSVISGDYRKGDAMCVSV